MWNILIKTKIKGEINEEGFDTSQKENIEDVLNELDTMMDLIDIDEVEIKINKLTFKQ